MMRTAKKHCIFFVTVAVVLPYVIVMTGSALAESGRKKEAEQKFREVLALSHDDAEAWKELEKLGVPYY